LEPFAAATVVHMDIDHRQALAFAQIDLGKKTKPFSPILPRPNGTVSTWASGQRERIALP